MPSISKTLLVAVAATGALASFEHQLMERELIDALDNELITRDEADHLVDIWARGADDEPLHVARAIADGEIEDALIARSDYDHLDDIYSRDLHERDLQIRSDIEVVFHDHDGLFGRALEQQEAILRVRELAARDPELFQLYRRGVKMTSLMGAVGGAVLAPKGHRLKGALAGGALGYGAHKAMSWLGSRNRKSKKDSHHDDEGHHKRGSYDGADGGGGYLGGYGGDAGAEYRRRDIDDPEIWEWE